MAQVGVDIVTKTDVDRTANKAADAMSRLAKQEELVNRTAQKMGVSVKDAAKFISLAEKEETALAKAAEKAAKALDKQKKSAVDAAKRGKEETLKQAKGIKSLLTGNVLEAAEKFPIAAIAAAGVTLALVAAGVAATALLVKVGSLAEEAGKARQSSLAMMGVLSDGQGAKTLALVDGLAEQLGMKFQDARDSFIKFRQAGLDNSTSAGLLKLKADLDTIDPSGKLAAQAIEKTLGHKKADGTIDIQKAREEMALLAKQAGVAGDGTAAAAARFTTLGGALKSLDNSKTKALETIWEKIEPAVNSAAGAIAKFADEFLKSKEGQKILEQVGSAISFIAKAVEATIPLVGPVLAGLSDAFENVTSALAPISDLISQAFGGDKASTAETIRSVVSGVATAIGIATAALAGLVAIGATFGAVISNPIALVTAMTAALGSMAEVAATAGASIVNGLISGLSSNASALYAKVADIAKGAWNSFKATLGISSPSKQFQFGGDMMGQGVDKGFENSAPDASDVAKTMVPEPAALKAKTGPAVAAAGKAMASASVPSTGSFMGVPESSPVASMGFSSTAPSAAAAPAPGPASAPALAAGPPAAASPAMASPVSPAAAAPAGLPGPSIEVSQPSAAPSAPPSIQPPAAPPAPPPAPAGGGSGPLVVIEQLTVQGGNATADEIASSTRRELEGLVVALRLARG